MKLEDYAILTRAAYLSVDTEESLEEVPEEVSFEDSFSLQWDVRGEIYRRKEEYIVGISGSSDPKHWLLNLQLFPANTEFDCRVHEGFLKGAEELLNYLENQKPNILKSQKITFTGHSLGAAIATIAAFFLSDREIQTRVIRFGCPKIGNQTFNKKVKRISEVVTVERDRDLVTNLPISFFVKNPWDVKLKSSISCYKVISNHQMNQYLKDIISGRLKSKRRLSSSGLI
jgi:hypothetical protein